ncbi:MAG: transglycosylase domain-containing protein [Clostridia bacterium]|nr:transglycosylase domain-containing protein [Clostridia bacterium]
MDKQRNNQNHTEEKPVGVRVTLGALEGLGHILLFVLKAIGTLLLVGVVAGLIFMSYFTNYLKKEVIPEAQNFAEELKLDTVTQSQTSFIYYYDKNTGSYAELEQIDSEENRVWASYKDIPEGLINSAIAIEDKRFLEHSGVDWITTGRACIKMFLGTGSAGGSTLTQQLIKNLTHEDEVTVHRKIQEIFRALEVEKRYSKQEIMEWYLNNIYLGEGCYGVQSAARVYFGKELSELTTAECASIISITNNPSLFDPYISTERNLKRQRIILDQLLAQGFIDKQEHEAATQQELDFHSDYGKEEVYSCPGCDFKGERIQFRENADDGHWYCPQCGSVTSIVKESSCYSYFVDTIIRDVVNDLMETYGYTERVAYQKLSTGGYKIYATIDVDAQNIVDNIYQDLSKIPQTDSWQQLQSGIVIIDNETGDIVAMSGGVGEKEGSLTLNRATQSRRQPGSSLKPISVYCPAFDLGVCTPATTYEDAPDANGWPRNDGGGNSGNMTVNHGVVSSLNTIAVKVLKDLGVETSFEYATERFGLSTLVTSISINGKDFTDKALAPLSMGALTYGVTVREMAQAYATFPNQGMFRQARTYTRVEDSSGKTILDNRQQTRQAVGEKAAWYMQNVLNNAVLSGTGWAAYMDGYSVCGKTGTTSDNFDRWFCGFTPYYTASVWCGFDENEEIKLVGDGTNPAVRLWKMVMTELHKGKESKYFEIPSGTTTVSICVDSGGLATDVCKEVYISKDKTASRVEKVLIFSEDAKGLESCDYHENHKVCPETGMLANEYCELFHAANAGEGEPTELKEIGVLVKCAEDRNSKYKRGEALDLEVCTVHTQAAWEAYQQSQKPEEDPEPVDPLDPTEPTEPSEPGGETGDSFTGDTFTSGFAPAIIPERPDLFEEKKQQE